MKNVIWSNFNDYVEAIEEDLRREPEIMIDIEPTEENIRQYAIDLTNDYHNDEIVNLDKKLNGRILVIADLGLWDGRRQGYKILGKNLNEVLYHNYDLYKVGIKRRNVVATEIHHDGTNHYEFREIREDRNIDNLLTDIYNGKEISRSRMNYYTKSLAPYVKEIYGC